MLMLPVFIFFLSTSALVLPVNKKGHYKPCTITFNQTFAFGTLQGCSEDNGEVFFSLPYAIPPINERRWTMPEMDNWISENLKNNKSNNLIEASFHKNICPQKPYAREILGLEWRWAGDEDCLTLDIYRPKRTKKGDNLSVFVWVHGGGNEWGDSYFYGIYDAKKIAARYNIIVVSIQYRLGVFGYMGNQALFKESKEKVTTGNYGHQDKLLALNWIKNHIKQFGGNPDDITVGGQSAGGQAACLLLSDDQAGTVYHKIMIESGGCGDLMPLETTFKRGADYYKVLGGAGNCAIDKQDMNCVRKLTTDEVMNTHKKMPGFAVTLDRSPYGILRNPIESLERKTKKIPVIAGYVYQEGLSAVSASRYACSQDAQYINSTCFKTIAMDAFVNKTNANCVVDKYVNHFTPIYESENWNDAVVNWNRDPLDCTDRMAIDLVNGDAYYYFFNHTNEWFDFDMLGNGRSYHGSELFFQFDTLMLLHAFVTDDPLKNALPTYVKSKIYSERFDSIWTNFVKNGNPGKKWKAYSQKEQNVFVFNDILFQSQTLENPRCLFWTECGVRIEGREW